MDSLSNSLIITLLQKLRFLVGLLKKTAALIGNVFVNGQAQKYNSGNITTSISDHLPQFIITENG